MISDNRYMKTPIGFRRGPTKKTIAHTTLHASFGNERKDHRGIVSHNFFPERNKGHEAWAFKRRWEVLSAAAHAVTNVKTHITPRRSDHKPTATVSR